MSQGETKNIGQIAAIWIANYAPDNTSLIWYDENDRIHKTYEESSGQWVALNPQIVTNSTISTLRTIAQGSGLAVGKFYYLTDVGTLAIAITTTKIWYVDSHGNYVVNDLSASMQYYVNSTNLIIDGSTGVWENGQLKFKFTTYSVGSFLQPNSDYIVLRRKAGDVWSWIKFKLRGLISVAAGNSITWNNGLFFNFNNALNAKKNTAGGVVGWEQHNTDKTELQRGINEASQANQNILNAAKRYTDGKTNDAYIYTTLQHGKPYTLVDNPPEVPGTGSVLHDIITILLSWIKKLKWSKNITIAQSGDGFKPNGVAGNVNYSDSVKTAIEKILYNRQKNIVWINSDNGQTVGGGQDQVVRISGPFTIEPIPGEENQYALHFYIDGVSDSFKLPSDFDYSEYADTGLPLADDVVTAAIGKLAANVNVLNTRPYINETAWHTHGIVSWTIRRNVLYFKVTQSGQHAVKIKSGLIDSTGVELVGLDTSYFSNLPWTYENTNSDGSITRIKFLQMCPIVNGSFAELEAHSGIILTAPVFWGLCVQCITDVDGNETWGVFIGTSTGSNGFFLFANANEDNLTYTVERRNLDMETIVFTYLPNAVFSVPLSF